MQYDNSTTINYIYSEFVNLTRYVYASFDTNGRGNFSSTVPLIGMESMVTRARLRYTRDYLTSGICSLINPIATETLMLFTTKIHAVMFWMK